MLGKGALATAPWLVLPPSLHSPRPNQMSLCISTTEVSSVHLAIRLQGWCLSSESGRAGLPGMTGNEATVHAMTSGSAWITDHKWASQEDSVWQNWVTLMVQRALSLPSAKEKGIFLSWLGVGYRAHTFIRNHWLVHLIPVCFAGYTFSLNEKVLKIALCSYLPEWIRSFWMSYCQNKI